MPPLTPAELDTFAAGLRALEAELIAALDRSVDGARPVELDQQAAGRVSRVDAIQQQQMVAANRRRAEARLAAVRRALAAIDADEYGVCRSCEEPIDRRRLQVRPESAICLRCQAAAEQRAPR